jgi:hypothetical protein
MAESLSGSVAFRLFMTLISPADMSSPQDEFERQQQFVIRNGAANLECDRIFHDTRTIAISTNDDLDLVNGGLLTPLGGSFSLARLKMIYMKAADGNGSQVLTIGNGTNAQPMFMSAGANTCKLEAGQAMMWTKFDATGWVCTGGSTDIIRINNGAGATATYDICMLGAST